MQMGVLYYYFNLFSFFLDKKRKKKIKNERQLQSFSRSESLRNTTEKIVVHTVRPRRPHYYQYVQERIEFVLCIFD